jgi:hypothetical protein
MVWFSLFTLWVITISWSIAFLIGVSLYLYSKRKPKASANPKAGRFKFVTDFVFVWVLIFLLFFYIVTIRTSSSFFFAVGNVLVELFLAAYIWQNRKRD